MVIIAIEVLALENKICVYAICKNELQFVDTWLDSMKEADYICVLDTGSTDGTYEHFCELQKSTYKDKLFVSQKEYETWRFDVARNDSMELIPEDANILVCTDLDEVFESSWATPLRANWIEGFHKRCYYAYTWSHDEYGNNGRTFTYDKIHSRDWYWKFPVHETLCQKETEIICSDNVESLNLFNTIHLHHHPDMSKSRGSYLPLLELRKKEYPDDWYGRIYLAHEYYYRGLYAYSINELKDIINNNWDNMSSVERASCYLFMGDSYFAIEEYQDALEAYWSSIVAEKTYREPYIAMARVFEHKKQWDSAIFILTMGIENSFRHYSWLERDNSWTFELWDMLSIACYNVGAYDRGILAAAKALSYEPNNKRLQDNLQWHLKMFTDKQLGDKIGG